MAIGYHRLNSSAARSRISAGRPEKGTANSGGEMPGWMTKNALMRPGDQVDSVVFGRGVVIDFVLTEFSVVRALFPVGEKKLTFRSVSKVEKQ